MNLVFMGTPEFAAVVLRHVLEWRGGTVRAVYTQPDRAAGRGQRLTPPPVKLLAQTRGLPVFQPANFRDDQDVRVLAGLQPDALIVAAYGLILPQRVLDVPRLGALNAHASLLPRHRGAAPVQRAIMAGETVTGMTIMRVERGLDSGPILLQRALAIGRNDTAGQILDELAELGGALMVEALEKLARQELRPVPQDPALATYAPKLEKEEAGIDWDRPALAVHAHVRGVTPSPGAWTGLDRPGEPRLRVLLEPGEPGPVLDPPARPGTLGPLVQGRLPVACADRWYLLSRLRPAAKKPMDAAGFFNGYLARFPGAGFAAHPAGHAS